MKVYRVKLTCEERAELQALLSKGKASARTLMHARILLVDDNAHGLCARKTVLEELGHRISTASSGTEALEQFAHPGVEPLRVQVAGQRDADRVHVGVRVAVVEPAGRRGGDRAAGAPHLDPDLAQGRTQ